MAQYAKIVTDAVIFNPIATIADPNSLYVDTTIGSKLTSEAPTAFGNTELLIKEMQAAEPIRAGRQVSKRADGKIVEAESDGTNRQQPIGMATIAFLNIDDLGNVLLPAPNAAGVLTGLGFTPGREIYIGETTGGYVDDITPFVGNDDSLIKVGVADCAAGVASGIATDLIMITQVIARP
jgi:hypothetical protein